MTPPSRRLLAGVRELRQGPERRLPLQRQFGEAEGDGDQHPPPGLRGRCCGGGGGGRRGGGAGGGRQAQRVRHVRRTGDASGPERGPDTLNLQYCFILKTLLSSSSSSLLLYKVVPSVEPDATGPELDQSGPKRLEARRR